VSAGLEFTATPETEAVLALERFRDELGRAEANPYDWKWAIIAGHNAIQNFMVCALDSPGRENLFSDRYNKEFQKWWHDRGGQGTPPETYMAVFLELYRRLATPFDAFKDMEAINYWRNEFIHFVMNSWSVSVRVLPGRFLKCLEVIDHCGWTPGRFDWEDASLKPRTQQVYVQCVQILTRLDAAHAAAGPPRWRK